MALDGYAPMTMAEGEELCYQDIEQLLNNVQAIRDEAGASADSVYCQEINETITVLDECAIVESPLKDPDGLPSSEIDTKLITFTYTASYDIIYSGSENDNPYADTKIIVSCGDTVIYETGYNECSSGQPVSFVSECPRDADIQFCVEIDIPSQFFGARINNLNVRICGGLLCIGSRERNLGGYFNLNKLDPNCCYGRDALCLAAQNAETLRFDLTSNCDQVALCNSVSVADTGSVPLIQNIQRGAIYLITGQIKICATNRSASFQDGTLVITPYIGCEGEQSTCATVRRTIPAREEGEPEGRTVCFSVPVIQCGVCQTGQTLFAGLTQVVDCETTGETGISGPFITVEVEQEYCVWLFEKVPLDGLPEPFTATLGQCLTADFTQTLAGFIDQLHDFMCDRQPVNLSLINPSLPNEYIVTGAQYSQTITLIPPDPDPLAAPKKWTTNLAFRPYYAGRQTNLDRQAEFTFTIRCGGNVLYTETVSWTISTLGGIDFFRRAGPCISFSGCLECDPNDGMTLTIETGPGTAQGTYTAQPLKLNMYCF